MHCNLNWLHAKVHCAFHLGRIEVEELIDWYLYYQNRTSGVENQSWFHFYKLWREFPAPVLHLHCDTGTQLASFVWLNLKREILKNCWFGPKICYWSLTVETRCAALHIIWGHNMKSHPVSLAKAKVPVSIASVVFSHTCCNWILVA